MAIFNESLVGRYDRLGSRLHNVKGHPVHPQVSPEIQHVIVLENDRPEFRYLEGTKPLSARTAHAPGAGNIAGARLRNPAGSGVLAVVRCDVTVEGAGGFTINLGGVVADLTQVQTALATDTRFGVLSSGAVIVSQPANAAAAPAATGFTCYSTALVANTPWRLPFSVVLAPGTTIDIRNFVVNTQMDCNFYWTERQLEAAEV